MQQDNTYSLVPRPPLRFFHSHGKKTQFSMAAKKAARGGLDARLDYDWCASFGNWLEKLGLA